MVASKPEYCSVANLGHIYLSVVILSVYHAKYTALMRSAYDDKPVSRNRRRLQLHPCFRSSVVCRRELTITTASDLHFKEMNNCCLYLK